MTLASLAWFSAPGCLDWGQPGKLAQAHRSLGEVAGKNRLERAKGSSCRRAVEVSTILTLQTEAAARRAEGPDRGHAAIHAELG